MKGEEGDEGEVKVKDGRESDEFFKIEEAKGGGRDEEDGEEGEGEKEGGEEARGKEEGGEKEAKETEEAQL